jgi:N-acetylglucosaminyldiphosphoundecaprenol N-acetyl-beta-D-mannosaminyltransferase
MSALTIPDAVRRILAAIQNGQGGYITVTGMHGIMESRDDPRLREIHNEAFLCTPDGMPGVWIGRATGFKEMDRVYGPDLMLALMQATQNLPVRHFFYGGAEGVADDLKSKMEERFPGVQIVGTYCPPFRPLNDAELAALKDQIATARPDIVWVGLSTPKQERFMAAHLALLDTKLMIGVGAAFDFHTGRALQAPRWIQRSGLEWAFRLVTNPRRLWKRYVIQVPRFAFFVLRDFCAGKFRAEN